MLQNNLNGAYNSSLPPTIGWFCCAVKIIIMSSCGVSKSLAYTHHIHAYHSNTHTYTVSH